MASEPAFAGMNRTQSRRFAASPQGQQIIIGQKNRAEDIAREGAAAKVAMNMDVSDSEQQGRFFATMRRFTPIFVLVPPRPPR